LICAQAGTASRAKAQALRARARDGERRVAENIVWLFTWTAGDTAD
jgi:hypothetical protein